MKLFRAPKLFRLFFVVMMMLALARMARAGAPEDLGRAMDAVRSGDYATAERITGAAGSVARDIVEWQRLRAGQGSFDDYRGFVARRPDWPGLPYLMRKGEAKIDDATPAADITAWFAIEPPQTGSAIVKAIRAYLSQGADGDAEALAVLAWRGESLSLDDESALLHQFPQLLSEHNVARMDMLLWRGLPAEAERLMPLVPVGWQKLAAARIGLRADANGIDAMIAAIPAALTSNPGLAYDRYQWRKRRGRDDDALSLMLERSTSAEALGYPELWSGDRRRVARDLMRDGKSASAFKVASRHFLQPEDDDYPDLEWLSGYIALRYLKDPQKALDHFTRFRMSVNTPISLGRAGYWEGRALEAMGAKADAEAAYGFGAEYQTSFYGLLAAERAGLPMDPALMGTESYPDWHGAPFLASSVMQAALLLQKAGETDMAERFMRHLCEDLDATGMGQMADMALDLGEPHIALRIAKFAADRGIVLNRAYYPVTGLAQSKLPVPTELALSIARRESEFDPVVVSHAGARGLMQLMPGTAQDMARLTGVDYALGRLTSDPDYNATLGSAYLAKLIGQFGQNWMLVAAAYNAGPGRPSRWLQAYGDPRDGTVDPVDWIETIPFDETRNYIMRVTESIPVYRARLHGKVEPISLTRDLTGR